MRRAGNFREIHRKSVVSITVMIVHAPRLISGAESAMQPLSRDWFTTKNVFQCIATCPRVISSPSSGILKQLTVVPLLARTDIASSHAAPTEQSVYGAHPFPGGQSWPPLKSPSTAVTTPAHSKHRVSPDTH